MFHTAQLKELLEESPVIAAVKDDAGFQKALEYDCSCIFLLYGSVVTVSKLTETAKKAGKTVFVHLDLISGLSAKEDAVLYIHEYTKADGIISTRPALVRFARSLKMYGILRYFVLDSMAYENLKKQLSMANPDMIEILPGLMPKVIKKISEENRIPVIAGGLISDREDVYGALKAGAVGISSTNPFVWEL